MRFSRNTFAIKGFSLLYDNLIFMALRRSKKLIKSLYASVIRVSKKAKG
jgi:hypothetical protein